jgi:hypothetical protein
MEQVAAHISMIIIKKVSLMATIYRRKDHGVFRRRFMAYFAENIMAYFAEEDSGVFRSRLFRIKNAFRPPYSPWSSCEVSTTNGGGGNGFIETLFLFRVVTVVFFGPKSVVINILLLFLLHQKNTEKKGKKKHRTKKNGVKDIPVFVSYISRGNIWKKTPRTKNISS